MFFPASKDATEEDYYIHAEFTPEEIKAGLAAPVQKFCDNSHGERPAWKREQLAGRKGDSINDRYAQFCHHATFCTSESYVTVMLTEIHFMFHNYFD